MVKPALWLVPVALIDMFLGFRVLSPIAIDTAFMFDTTLLAHLGWRGINGLSPTVDFQYFHGGVTSANLTLAFELFGISMKSVDYAFAMIFAQTGTLLVLLSCKRLPTTKILLLLLVAAALILGPISIEDGYRPIVNHSFLYNHVAMVVTIAVFVFALSPRTTSRPLDIGASVIAGAALFVLALTKPTFIVIAPFVLALCCLARDWRACTLALLGFLGALALLDPWAARFSSSFTEIMLMGEIERVGGLTGRLVHTFWTILAHSGFLFVLGYFIWLYHRTIKSGSGLLFSAALLSLAGFGAMTLSMNGKPDLMLLPIILTLLVLISERLAQAKGNSAKYATFSATVFAAILVGPSAYYTVETWLRTDEARSHTLISHGPLADYAILDQNAPRGASQHAGTLQITEENKQATNERFLAGTAQPHDFFLILSDGVTLLRRIPNVETLAIVTRRGKFDFTFPLRAKPVPSYPVLPRQRSMSFLEMSEVDIVMSVKNQNEIDLFSPETAATIENEFHVCLDSIFFELLTRRAEPHLPCEQ